ncbi:MAG: transglycosylase SLT domain-containing protein [Myxococcales bacterium]|nr:transglycosylase SLT domain-containing protein [Myxococcales bacterium]
MTQVHLAVVSTLSILPTLLTTEPDSPEAPESLTWDLPQLQQEGVLRVALPYDTVSLRDGALTSFEADLLGHVARDLQVELDVRPLGSIDAACRALTEGRIDAIGGFRTDAEAPESVVDLGCPTEWLTVSLEPFGQGVTSLAVRPSSDELRVTLGVWIESQDRLRRLVAHRHFGRVTPRPASLELSRYDGYFQAAGRHLGWDWRLLAAQAFQESSFDPAARSSSGALGLMQLLPGTAREVGTRQPLDPYQSVQGAARYLQRLQERWHGRVAHEDQLAFVLASYNVGPGHVEDAVRLAVANGEDGTRWNVVAYWLQAKTERGWADHPVVQYGACEGHKALHYVDSVLRRFANYRQLVPPAGSDVRVRPAA